MRWVFRELTPVYVDTLRQPETQWRGGMLGVEAGRSDVEGRKILGCPLTPQSVGRISQIMRNWSPMLVGRKSSSCIVPAVALKSRWSLDAERNVTDQWIVPDAA